MDFKEILEQLADGQDLQADEAAGALRAIISGEISDAEIAAFLFGMRAKGETTQELTAFVRVMREAAVKPDVEVEGAVDLCGTGGDNSGTFNISTAAMFVVAGAGVPVLKHGNRSVSSNCGSADVLEALGAVPTLRREGVEQVFRETGMAFMFAPHFHPAMKHVMPARRALGVRTFFNILGPLLNPAGVRRQMVGAYSREVARQMVQILANLDTEFAYGVNAHDGLDEVSVCAQTVVFELNGKMINDSVIFDPRSLDFEWHDMEELQGGGREVNAGIIRDLLSGDGAAGPRSVVLLNAAFGINASGMAGGLQEARKMADDSLASGEAQRALERFAEATRQARSEEEGS
ncbi:MAG: anthranilate phosphoribosyltransferase [Balneolaceae bacterium]|nr:anthranilate phosphoribosyltransferase [Balneolaceae bacterium]